MVLIFFVEACLMFVWCCFGSVTNLVVISHQCLSCCRAVLAQSRTFLLLMLCCQCTQAIGKRHSWDSWPRPTKGISHSIYNIMLHNKRWYKEGESGILRVIVVISRNCYAWWALHDKELSEHLPAYGNQWMSSLFYFACVHSFCIFN